MAATGTKGTILVTGGSSGLGEATARELTSAGYNVVIADLNDEAGAAVVKSIGLQARFIKTSVTERSQVSAAVQLAITEFGRLDGVVHCAGVGGAMKTVTRGEPHDEGLFDFVVKVNLYGTFNVSSIAAAAMAKQTPRGADKSRGVIINVASVAAFEGQKGQLAYAASKGAVRAMTLPMARDLAKAGIRVCTIAPGIFATPMMAAASDKVRNALLKDVVCPKRFGEPSEFGALARSIIENPYLNGITIRLDGAIRMSNL